MLTKEASGEEAPPPPDPSFLRLTACVPKAIESAAAPTQIASVPAQAGPEAHGFSQ